jgi:hypothetical protein
LTENVSLDDPQYRLSHLLTLLVIPFIELAANPAAFINPGANVSIDAWVNTGLFLSLPSHVHRFGSMYYATRLTWLLPGFVAHRVLPPLVANYALHFLLFYCVVWVTYRLLSSGADRHVAMLGTLLVAWSPAILAAVGSDYVDGAGIAFLMTTLWCVERAANSRRDVAWSAAAGCAVACLLITNLALVVLLPACGMFLVLRAGPPQARGVLRALAAAVAGTAFTLVAFAVINRSLGGRWLFLDPSVRFAVLMSAAANPWRGLDFHLSRAVWLAVPACASIGAIISLIARPAGHQPFASAVQATLLTAVATWVGLDAAMHSAFLQFPYYVSYLVPLALVALPLQADLSPRRSGWRAALGLELAVCAALGVAHVTFLWHGTAWWNHVTAWLSPNPDHPLDRLTVIMAALMTVGIAAVLLLRSAARSATRAVAAVAAIAVVFAAPHLWQGAGVPDARTRFETVAAAHRFIGGYFDRPTMRFWYRFSSDDAPPFRSIASTYMWSWLLVNEDLPHLTSEQARALGPDTRLVFLIDRETERDDARAALRQFGYDFSVVGERQFGAGRQACRVVIADLTRAPQVF